MNIKILGTAAATAMPLPFCGCNVCRQARANGGKDLRKRSHAVIGGELLIDLSPDLCTSAGLYQVDLSKIRYLLQTHSHSDHFDAGHFVTRWSDYATQNLTHLDIYCSKGTALDMRQWILSNEPSIDFLEQRWQEDLDYSLHFIKPGDTVSVGGYRVTAIDSLHDGRVEALIYLISCEGKNFLYGTDLLELSDTAWKMLEGIPLDAVLLDQTYGEGFNNGGHLDAGQVSQIVKRMRESGITDENSRIYATHISHEGNEVHEKMEAIAAKNGYHIAYDGLEIEL